MRQDQDGNEKETDPTSSSQPLLPPPLLLPCRCFTTAEFVQLEFTLFPNEAQPSVHKIDSFQRQTLLHINLHLNPIQNYLATQVQASN